MIKVEPCKGCGGVILVDDFMGLRVRCNPTPLDAHAAGAALLAGQSLYRVRYASGRPSSFGGASTDVLRALRGEPSERPMVVVQHRCPLEAAGARLTASQKAGEGSAPKDPSETLQSPPVASGTPSSAPETDPSGATTAERPRFKRRSREPRCDGCGQPMADGTYASIAVGDLVVWAAHVTDCNGE